MSIFVFMKELLPIIFSIWISSLFSQNLIPNPSFEQCSKCDSRGFKELYDSIDWTAATYGTPDIQSFASHTGMKHGGFFLGFQKFEYLTTHLTEALKPGFKYRCSFHIRPDTRAPYYAIDQFGVYFQQGLPNYPQALPLSQLKPYFETPDGEHIATDSYKNYNFEFTACGGEDHIVLGVFHPLAGNDTLFIGKTRQFPQTSIPIYYLIDDVSLEKITVIIILMKSVIVKVKTLKLYQLIASTMMISFGVQVIKQNPLKLKILTQFGLNIRSREHAII